MRLLVFFLQLGCVLSLFSHHSLGCLRDQRKIAGLYDEMKKTLETRLLDDLKVEAAKADNREDAEVRKLLSGAINYIHARDHFLFNDPIMIQLWRKVQQEKQGTPEHAEALTQYKERLDLQEGFLRRKFYPEDIQIPRDKMEDYPTLNAVAHSIIASRNRDHYDATAQTDEGKYILTALAKEKSGSPRYREIQRDLDELAAQQKEERLRGVIRNPSHLFERAMQNTDLRLDSPEGGVRSTFLPDFLRSEMNQAQQHLADEGSRQVNGLVNFTRAWQDFEKNDLQLARIKNRMAETIPGSQEHIEAVKAYDDYLREKEAELQAQHFPEPQRIETPAMDGVVQILLANQQRKNYAATAETPEGKELLAKIENTDSGTTARTEAEKAFDALVKKQVEQRLLDTILNRKPERVIAFGRSLPKPTSETDGTPEPRDPGPHMFRIGPHGLLDIKPLAEHLKESSERSVAATERLNRMLADPEIRKHMDTYLLETEANPDAKRVLQERITSYLRTPQPEQTDEPAVRQATLGTPPRFDGINRILLEWNVIRNEHSEKEEEYLNALKLVLEGGEHKDLLQAITRHEDLGDDPEYRSITQRLSRNNLTPAEHEALSKQLINVFAAYNLRQIRRRLQSGER